MLTSKTHNKGKRKVSAGHLKTFPEYHLQVHIHPFFLFHLPSLLIPTYYLPRITLNRQTDRRQGKSFWCTPEFDYYLCHYISWHQCQLQE